MNKTFKGLMTPAWMLNDVGIIYKDILYKFEDIIHVREGGRPQNRFQNGFIYVEIKNKVLELTLAYGYGEKQDALEALEFMVMRCRAEEKKRKEREGQNLVYDLVGVAGRHMKVYEDHVLISTKASMITLVTGNFSDGEKTLFYSDCIGVQFKESGVQIGYLQLETASSMMNMRLSNFFNENTFTFDPSVQTNEKMQEVAEYIKKKVSETKNTSSKQPVVEQTSVADEIRKFKELLDMGAITQEEYDLKKKELLNL